MSAGRNKPVKTPKIDAPPTLTQTDFTSPLGDRYITRREGNVQRSDSVLSDVTQSAIDASQQGVVDLATSLGQPDAARLRDIAQKAQAYYDVQAQAVNSNADAALSTAQADLAKRFGGAYNATFGADYLARLEGGRQAQLADAARQATLAGEELFRQDQAGQLQRFSVLNDYLLNEFNKAQQAAGAGGQLLEGEANRAQNLAVQRASLLQRARESSAGSGNTRLSLLNQIVPATVSLLSALA